MHSVRVDCRVLVSVALAGPSLMVMPCYGQYDQLEAPRAMFKKPKQHNRSKRQFLRCTSASVGMKMVKRFERKSIECSKGLLVSRSLKMPPIAA